MVARFQSNTARSRTGACAETNCAVGRNGSDVPRGGTSLFAFRATDANRPFVTRNAELLGILAPQFDEELKQENGDENFVERVRIAIQQKLTGRRPTIEDIADALHISSRTVSRRFSLH